MKQASVKWLRQAKHDLEMAGKNLEIGGFDIAAFLSHQAVEKLLKAIIISDGGKPPRTHYLDELAVAAGMPEIGDDVIELTEDYMISRYPDVSEDAPFEEYDRNIASEKVLIATGIFLKAEQKSAIIEALHENG